MKEWLDYDSNGDLPVGIHQATLAEVIEHFGQGNFQLSDEVAVVFDHMACQNYEGASVFWVRKMAAIGGEQAAIEFWQTKRDDTKRGIVEVTSRD
jgi:hypothetical protein